MSKKKLKWTQVTNHEANAITGSTANPGQVFPYDINRLPTSLQQLPGLYAAYITSYVTSSFSPEGMETLGKTAVIREDKGIGKAYVYYAARSGSQVYFTGPEKYFDDHHFPDTGSIPIAKLFDDTPDIPW